MGPPSHIFSRKLTAVRAALAFVVLAILTILAVGSTSPPAAAPASAPVTEFSAARAMEHVTLLAQRPRRPGSVAHDEARSYLLPR
jgi:hypothetical protein